MPRFVAGAASEAGFCVAYGVVARRSGWPLALAAGSLGFVACGFIFATTPLSLWPMAATCCVTLAGALHLMPRLGADTTALARPLGWDILARMVVATVVVLCVTAVAPLVGPRLSGLFATYPVFAAVLAAFSQRGHGAGAAVQVLRGLLIGLFAFTGFFVVIASTLERVGIAGAFIVATLVALVIQAGSLQLMRRRVT